jgi:hypothetical protein
LQLKKNQFGKLWGYMRLATAKRSTPHTQDMMTSHMLFVTPSELTRGSKPFEGVNVDGKAISSMLNSRAHAYLRERLRSAKSSEFVVYEAREIAPDNAVLRRCTGAELRTKLRTIVLPLASERHGALQSQILFNRCGNPASYVALVDTDYADDIVPYLVSFCISPLQFLPKTMDVESARLLANGGGVGDAEQLVCVLQTGNCTRSELTVTDLIMGMISQRVAINRICNGCGVVVDGRLKCSVCRKAVYCSKECQKVHWCTGGHKQECGCAAEL